jgi:hypothetical protein
MFRNGLDGLGKDSEKVKDDVAPRIKENLKIISR